MAVQSLVSCAWLRQELARAAAGLLVLESTWLPRGKARDSYLKEHIPTARFFDMWEGVRPKRTFARPLPNMNVFRQQLQRVGVTADTHVVLYDGGDIKFAARMWIQCREIGLRRVSVLEGGLNNWKLNGYPLESGDMLRYTTNEGELQSHALQPSLCCGLKDMSDIISTGTRQIVDSRESDFFAGVCKEPSPSTLKAFKEAQMDAPLTVKRGHMRGAKNVFYESLLDSRTGCFKTQSQLKQIFGDAGVDVERPTVSTCYTGQTACLVPLALSKLGLDVRDHRVYLGSWTEFGQLGSPKYIECENVSVYSPQQSLTEYGQQQVFHATTEVA